MSKLEILYKLLITNQKHHLKGWLTAYLNFIKDVENIKENLIKGTSIREKETYANTRFATANNPFDAFIRQLLYEKSNGIASRGQSVISKDKLEALKNAAGFEEVLIAIIKEPKLESYEEFKRFWEETKGGKNPVLVNRALAACTLNVTSTVDESKFNQVLSWLITHGYIDKPSDGERQNWFTSNQFVIQQFRNKLQLEDTPENRVFISQFYWNIYVYMSNPFSLKKQVVKYGAPGTGKTYKAKETSNLQFDIWKSEYGEHTDIEATDVIDIVQFHPSYSYEDFLEGLRPNLDGKLTLANGVFKNICKSAGKWEVDVANIDATIDLKRLTIGDITKYKEQLSGKDYWTYIFEQDSAKKLVDCLPPYFLIIDEINRADLSRVFGELMYCLEYRGVNGRIKTQYAHLNTAETSMIEIGGAHQFFVPHNFYILATMNTVDRSVESFDFALRRRFKWEEVSPDISLLRNHLQEYNNNWTSLADNLERLNNAIEKEILLGKDYCIGHAYLWELPYDKSLTALEVSKLVWDDSLSSLLEEYLRGTGRSDLLNSLAKSFGIS